ncbi:DEAD/DEAH box helicase [Gallibacterium anatis]|uniref:DEAD/DEAH box helicase n=1 Tax=Gallibacterium anatis TaxID=750 RepID=UPI000530E92B|nr:DEAD/DEAH box helicase [Gallibacterium anatis]KGQ29357.1 hypothetical protein JP27_01230 [Gallibacterium anatis]
MKKYTANYTYTNPNFVIQNLPDGKNEELLPTLYVLKNILQRGFPTTLSKFLQSKLGSIHKLPNFNERFLFADPEIPIWYNTIMGDSVNDYFPTKIFLEEILPRELGEYAFVTSMFLPEVEINEITGIYVEKFAYQRVDLYSPTLKLVIEIDGQQHKSTHQIADEERNSHLFSKGIKTIRISTLELQDGSYKEKIKDILFHIERNKSLLSHYKKSYDKIISDSVSELEIQTKLLPTAIIRFQILILELLERNELNFIQEWNFYILNYEDVGDYATFAIEDLEIWFSKLWELRTKEKIKFPNYNVHYICEEKQFVFEKGNINVDFSLLKRYTDENELNKDVIFLRNDYFDILKDKNYFRVSTTEPINYKIVESDKEILEFFLDNIFDKPSFRDGQFPIVSNALNQKDTIGLLPTGGGKSLCYQLPCLLQPAVNFVVCPIKSLMYDQNDNLVKTLVTNVNFITSDLTPDERNKIENEFELGRYLFVWISPEKLQIPTFRSRLSAIISNLSVAYAVIDEVHCLSEWGHDFRTSYLNLARTVDSLSPRDVNGEGLIKFIGLTATASVNVLKDIKIEFSRQKSSLEDNNIKALLDYSRKELQFEVINDGGNKLDTLKNLIKKLEETEGFMTTPEKAGLVFTPYVNGNYGCYTLANNLEAIYQNKVGWFAGSVPKKDKQAIMSDKEFNSFKQQTQRDFKENKYQLLIATKAFGMGIDKQNIFYTFHYGLPSSVESLYQEAGRAGRWDKRSPENQSKLGKCYVLHSHEIIDSSKVQNLFDRSTSFEEMSKINDDARWNGRDIMKQIFLFIQGQNDVDKDFKLIRKIIELYYKENSKVVIFWRDAKYNLGIDSSLLEKQIYRLSLLGIVSDWTTDFINSFDVYFNTINEQHVINSVEYYISKYEPSLDINKSIKSMKGDSLLDKSINFLLVWIFENISYNRKQSLKTLSDWCSEFKDSESFKKRLDSYFTFTDLTFVLQHIAENPFEYEKWLDVFSLDTKPQLSELESLKDSLSRFLESYRNNTGLNFISGLIRLVLNEFDDSDGRNRLQSAIQDLEEKFDYETKIFLIDKLIEYGFLLETEEQKAHLAFSITNTYPDKIDFLAEHYGIDYIKLDLYKNNFDRMKYLTRGLHEQLARF